MDRETDRLTERLRTCSCALETLFSDIFVVVVVVENNVRLN